MSDIRQLPPHEARDLARRAVSLAEPPSLDAPPPPGFTRLEESRTLPRVPYSTAQDELITLGIHARAGLDPRASADPLAPGTDLLLHSGGAAPVSIPLPYRALAVEAGPTSSRLALATLERDSLSAVDEILIRHEADGASSISIRSVHRPSVARIWPIGATARSIERSLVRRLLRAAERMR